MTRQLETDLRAAFTRLASEVPAGASARLRAIDYHPRSRRVRPPIAFGALAGAAGTAAAVIGVVGLSAGASSAFAGWTSTPTAPSGPQTASADATCEAKLAGGPAGISAAGLQPVLNDTRGPFTAVVLAGSSGAGSSDTEWCITSPSFTASGASAQTAGSASGEGSATGMGVGSVGRATITGGSASATVAAGQIKMDLLATSDHTGAQYTLIAGRTGAGVTGVTLVLSDGEQVSASTANGWFAAWWPSDAQVSTADVTTPTGVTTQQLDTVSPGQCGPGPCAPPPAGGSLHTGGTGGTTASGTSTATSNSRR